MTKSFIYSVSLLAVCISICLIAGLIGSLAMGVDSFEWYRLLNKSSLTPPDWAFAPIWTAIYIFMGFALYLIIRNSKSEFFITAISLFSLQLVLNILWTYIFFASRQVGYAYAEILILDAVVLILIPVVGKISRMAQMLLLPYVIWLGIATYLNWYVMYYN